MERNYKLYVHISPSNKRYYGITQKKNVNRRWQNGNGYKNNIHFFNAITKYGWDNFKHEVLFIDLTKEEACLLEQCYIALYDSTNPSKGYNRSYGGETNRGFTFTEESKKKLSDAHKGKTLSDEHKHKISESEKGEKHWLYGKHHSDETKQKISKANKGKNCGENNHNYGKLKGENHPMYGKHHTDETKRKISENNSSSRKVICLNTGEVFNSIKEASQKMNLNYNSLRQAIPSNKKYKGYVFMYYEEYLNTKTVKGCNL